MEGYYSQTYMTPVFPHIDCLIRRIKHDVSKINIGTCEYFTSNYSELVVNKCLQIARVFKTELNYKAKADWPFQLFSKFLATQFRV